jgi:hypothetical protein
VTSTPARRHQGPKTTPTTDPGSPTGSTAFVPPPKIRRRPAVVAGGVAAVCLGALLEVWAWTSTTHSEEVLAARATIHRGDVITANDVERVRISGGPALDPLPASAYDAVVGKTAALDIASGGLLTQDATADSAMPPKGQSVVGISLTAAQVPALPLQGGDHVRIIVTPGQNGTPPAGVPEFSAAEVVDTRVDGATGNTVVDVLVPYADASVLASRAATGNVALVLDAAETRH